MKEIPEELLPVIEWWEKNGKQAIVTVVVAAVVVAGYYGFKHRQEQQRQAASAALVSSQSLEELEGAVADFGSSKAGPAIKMRLAKKYFEDGKYDAALDLYKELNGKAPEGFADVPAVGAAQCLEAQGKFDEAAKAFEDFAAANEKSLLLLTAKLGAARCYAGAGDKAKALAALEALKAEKEGDALSVGRIEDTIDVIKRWEKRDLVVPAVAPAAAAAVEEAAKAVEAPAVEAAKPAEPAPKAE